MAGELILKKSSGYMYLLTRNQEAALSTRVASLRFLSTHYMSPDPAVSSSQYVVVIHLVDQGLVFVDSILPQRHHSLA